MSDIEKIVKDLNLPKQLVDKADRFLSALLGPSVAETGQLLADKVRFRRLKNQVSILRKAEALLSEAAMKPNSVALKTLVPLLEAASLEEEDSIQDLWAGLLANATEGTGNCALHSICIQVLSTISPDEAKALRRMYSLYQKRRDEVGNKYRARQVTYRIAAMFEGSEISDRAQILLVDNLVRLNMIERKGGIHALSGTLVNLTDLGLGVLSECNFSGTKDLCRGRV